MLEAALALTTALIILAGLVQLGIIFMLYQGVSERARIGVRYATTAPASEEAIKNVIVYGNSAGTGAALFGLSPADITIGSDTLDNESDIAKITVDLRSQIAFGSFLVASGTTFRVEAAAPVERALEAR